MKSPKRLPLDFAKLVAHRRANRVAAYKHLEGNNDHYYNIQKAVELENQFNERHRMEDRLRLGGLPVHVTRPIFEAMLKGAVPKAPETRVPKAKAPPQNPTGK